MRLKLTKIPSIGSIYDWMINKVTRNYGRRIDRLQKRVTKLEAALGSWQVEFNEKQEQIVSDFERRLD